MRSAACLITSVAMSPPKFTSTTISSASKSSWHLTAASPHWAGLPLVLRSASTANRPSLSNAEATMPTSSLPTWGQTARRSRRFSNWPSWLEASMKRKFNSPTRPCISFGVDSCNQRETDHHADGFAARATPAPAPKATPSVRAQTQRSLRGTPQPETSADLCADGAYGAPTARSSGGQQLRRRAEDAKARRTGRQDIAGVDRQERRDTVEQHCEQVQRERPQSGSRSATEFATKVRAGMRIP